MNVRKYVIVFGLLILIVSLFFGVTLFMGAESPEEENHAPQLIVTNPSDAASLSGTVEISVSILDEENLTADIYIDGQFVTSANDYTWDTTRFPDGRHTLRFYVEDSSEQSDKEAYEVTVDNVDDSVFTSNTFKVMVYNIKESGVNSNWLTVVKQENPDILVLVETGYFDDDANENLNAYTSDLNDYFSDEAPYDSYTAIVDSFPTTGEAILSRFPIINFTQIGYVPLDDGSNYDVTHDFIQAVVDINGVAVHVFGAHLKASGGETNQNRRELETEGIINYMDNLGPVPIMYLSDQNSYSPDDVGDLAPNNPMTLGYGPMTMMLYPSNATYGNHSSEIHTFIDVFRTLNPDDRGYTFGHQTSDTAIRIDYIIVNSYFEDMLMNSTVSDAPPAGPASDHYAVTAFLNWTIPYVPEIALESDPHKESIVLSSTNHHDGDIRLVIVVAPIVQYRRIIPLII